VQNAKCKMQNKKNYMRNGKSNYDLQKKTKKFALNIIAFCNCLSEDFSGRTIRNQLFRCGTSVGANYRAVCIAKTKKDFIAKLGIVQEEADETRYWLELLEESGMVVNEEIKKLYSEASQIYAMVVASMKTAKRSI